jgi:multisubunit Na+/H+ antiporter MnhB subunit
MALGFDISLAFLVVVLAAWTIQVHDTFSAVLAFVVFGLLVALIWVRLASVDVALTEAAIGSGVTGALLLSAAALLRPTQSAVAPPGAAWCTAAGAVCAIITAGLGAIALLLPDPAPTLAPLAAASLPQSGLGNPVTGVLFVYRALDTLLEKVVLVLALVGVWSLAVDRLWGGIPALWPATYPDSTLTFLAQLLPPVGLMLGIYLCWTGADHPGGAFQGGALLTAMWLLVMLAGVRAAPATGLLSLRLLLIAGPTLFLVIGLSGFALAGAFLAYPPGYSKPLIIVAEAALTLSIGVTLGLLAAGPAQRAKEP